MKFLPRQEGVFSNQKRKPCVACHELIVSGARLCPYCRTVQHAEPWKLIANGLKWIAGATAVISLMIGVTQINRFYQDWREKREAIAELVDASRIQTEPGGYFRAWDLLQEASHLEPGSRLVRRQMVELAMIWFRTLMPERSGTYDIINRLLPTLARGAASADKQIAADVFAHIGWASLLLNTPEPGGRERPVPLDVDRHFTKALELDQNNAYAHAMLGVLAAGSL